LSTLTPSPADRLRLAQLDVAVGFADQRTHTYTGIVADGKIERPSREDAELKRVLARQADADAHDLGLIVERLAWTPEQRLEANAAFLRFYASARPAGPILPED
jgi:hypothetical protein